MGQERQERGVRLREHDLDGSALAAPDLPDETIRAAKRADPGRRARGGLVGRDSLGEGGDDVVDPEGRAVVKLDVRTQPEGPDEPVP